MTAPPNDGWRERLAGAQGRLYELMRDWHWHDREEIERAAGCSGSAATARVRSFRNDARVRDKYPNGGVESKNMGGGKWRYRLLPPVAEKKQKALFGVGGEEYR